MKTTTEHESSMCGIPVIIADSGEIKPDENETSHREKFTEVTLLYIGEGKSGDYDPEDPSDIPLLRMDVSRQGKYGGEDVGDEEWGIVRNGSFCTCLSARLSKEDQKNICQHIARELDKIPAGESLGRVEVLSYLSTAKEALQVRVKEDRTIHWDALPENK